MSNVLTFDKIKEKTFDDAIAQIKKSKPPKTWNEMVDEGEKGPYWRNEILQTGG